MAALFQPISEQDSVVSRAIVMHEADHISGQREKWQFSRWEQREAQDLGLERNPASPRPLEKFQDPWVAPCVFTQRTTHRDTEICPERDLIKDLNDENLSFTSGQNHVASARNRELEQKLDILL
ncbi:hypothetical protein DMENIID0001_114700 [Sergentomyia squamirostris]